MNGSDTAQIRRRYGGDTALVSRLYWHAATRQPIFTLFLHLLLTGQVGKPTSIVRSIASNAVEEPENTMLLLPISLYLLFQIHPHTAPVVCHLRLLQRQMHTSYCLPSVGSM